MLHVDIPEPLASRLQQQAGSGDVYAYIFKVLTYWAEEAVDETTYLLASTANAEHLALSRRQAVEGKVNPAPF